MAWSSELRYTPSEDKEKGALPSKKVQQHQQSCLCKQNNIKQNSEPKHNQARGKHKITHHLPKANFRHAIVKHFLAIGIGISSGIKYGEMKKYNH